MNNPTDKVRSLGDYTRLVRRRWPYLATIMPGCLLLAVVIAYLLPSVYRASGTLMLEPPSVPTKMIPTIVGEIEDVNLDASQQLELLRRRVLTEESLLEVVKAVDPYPEEGPGVDLARKAARIARDTSVEAVDPITLEQRDYSTSFSIHYVNSDPRRAVAVAERLLDLFVSFNRRMRAEQAEETYRFLQAQAKQLELSMDGMETRLAAFKAKYGDALPEAQARNLAGVERAQRDLDIVEREILAAEEREALLQLQFEALSPSLTAAVGDWRAELARLRGELALAEQRYTAEHPDVRRLKRAVVDMASQGAASEAAQAAAPDNPEYLRVRSQLTGVRRELANLRGSAARIRGSLVDYQQNVATAPNVERDYMQLAREYENTQKRYADIQEKIKAASLSQVFESEARGERFTLIRNASAPRTPYSPNRLGISLLGFVLGGGLALLVAVIVDASDPTVRGAEDFEELFAAPIGAVPPIFNQIDLRRRKLLWGSVSAAYLAAVFLAVVVVATSA
jgi:polysaccharide chain length determinant protein (PEP-CTERM system associated)